MSACHKQLLATLAYYDAQAYPLTTFEAWRHLIDFSKNRQSASFPAVMEALQLLERRQLIGCVSGFWCFKGREQLAQERIRRQKISVTKLKAAKKWAALLQVIPFINGIIVTGTLALKRSGISSDWDVVVITKRRMIWLGRAILTGVLYLAGKWRHDEQTKDRFCLNHFITEDALLWEEQNEFTAKEVSWGIPLIGKASNQKLQQLNEYWLQQYKPNFFKDQTESFWLKRPSSVGTATKKIFERILEVGGLAEWLNERIKQRMITKIQHNPLTYVPGADIRYSDRALVFLPAPQKEKIIAAMLARLTEIKQ